MKTITKTYKAYNLEELSKEAQEVARAKWAEDNEYYFLNDYLNEALQGLLEKRRISYTGDTSVLYSLGYCQGDGAMFEGDFIYKSYNIKIKHVGLYCHYNSKTITITDDDGIEVHGQIYEDFNKLYIEICKELERLGYDYIEYEDSMESFIDTCEANGYMFTEDGVIDNN